MPIYVMGCESCDMSAEVMTTYQKSSEMKCGLCGSQLVRLPALVAMRPDNLWSGVMDRGYGYLTSTTQLKRMMKERHHVDVRDRTDIEGFEKMAEQGKRDNETRINRNIRAWTEKTFGPSGLGLGGADGAQFLTETN